MSFAKLFNLPAGTLLVVKDPQNTGITFTTVVGTNFRTASTTFKDKKDTADAFESMTEEDAVTILNNMLTAKNIYGPKDE